jgi:hypothetical protein
MSILIYERQCAVDRIPLSAPARNRVEKVLEREGPLQLFALQLRPSYGL